MRKGQREITEFQRRVYAATERVPPGKVTTYKHLARAVGCGSSRAVGQALKVNPYAPDVPCHRVIRSDLTIGGFSGEVRGPQIQRKRALLLEEGIRFEGDRLGNVDDLYTFGDLDPSETPSGSN